MQLCHLGAIDSFPPEEAQQAVQKEIQQKRPVLTCIKRCVERDIPVYGKDNLYTSSVSLEELETEESELDVSETERKLDEWGSTAAQTHSKRWSEPQPTMDFGFAVQYWLSLVNI